MSQKVEIKIDALIVNQLDVPNEYDTTYICKLFENTNG